MRRTLAKILILSTMQLALGIRECTQISTSQDLAALINNAVDTNLVLVCPFILRDVHQTQPVAITRPDISVVCFKENPTDVCEFRNERRHMTIFADRVTIVGFTFKKSLNSAVRVNGKSVSLINCDFEE